MCLALSIPDGEASASKAAPQVFPEARHERVCRHLVTVPCPTQHDMCGDCPLPNPNMTCGVLPQLCCSQAVHVVPEAASGVLLTSSACGAKSCPRSAAHKQCMWCPKLPLGVPQLHPGHKALQKCSCTGWPDMLPNHRRAIKPRLSHKLWSLFRREDPSWRALPAKDFQQHVASI